MLKNLDIYLTPLSETNEYNTVHGTVGSRIQRFTSEIPEMKSGDLVIIGVREGRNCAENEGCIEAPHVVRTELYKLFLHDETSRIFDIGDIKAGHTVEDTLFAVEQVVSELVMRGIMPIVIGGADHIGYGLYRAYSKLERMVNIVSLDPCFDIGDDDGEVSSTNHLSRTILYKPGYLFNYTNIGHQTYLVNPEMKAVMKRMFFDTHRLGEVRDDLSEMEPVIRMADTFHVDTRVIRNSDFPAHRYGLPHGLSGEEYCQLMRYAGLNEKLSSVFIGGFNPSYDERAISAQLIAQSIWCFMQGHSERHEEDLFVDPDQFTRYRVPVSDHELIFYKSGITDRWWMEVPYPPSGASRYKRAFMVPCSYSDYQDACSEDMPDRWWQTAQKLQ